jgi:SAM-dependent methyltransferase
MANRIRGDGLLPPPAYDRDDDTPDPRFYESPRKVVHIDDGAITALGRLYAEVLPAGGRLLDLMSSWRTHLPAGFHAREVVGLGLNAEEMRDNPQLARHVVHDLNDEPRLPFPDASFEGAMCAVSIQYVLHPVLVFREVQRVLGPGAPFVVAFSNRCFPTKATRVWLHGTDADHIALVRRYFDAAGGWADIRDGDRSADDGDPLLVVWARTTSSGGMLRPPWRASGPAAFPSGGAR